MPAKVRQQLKSARRIVIKVGSHTVCSNMVANGEAADSDTRGASPGLNIGLNIVACKRIASQIQELHKNHEVLLVSSGSVAAGAMARGLTAIPHDIPTKQALAALGQGRLMRAWEDAFSEWKDHISLAQVLLTHDDLADRRRYLNSRQTLLTLLNEYKAIPVINENDTVAVHEIKLGDNDILAAQVAALVEADLLIMLTTTDGLYSADPTEDSGAEHIPVIFGGDTNLKALAGGPGKANGLSVGGMATKVEAASSLARKGIPTVIANGATENVITDIVAGKEIGTLVMPEESPLTARKHWIVYTLKTRGELTIDDGAAKALTEQGRSLLPSGVVRVEGDFGRGEAVSIRGGDGVEIARGLAEYNASDMKQIVGKQTSEIEAILGYIFGDELVHRNDLVVMK